MTRPLVVTENVTLDGVMDLSEGWFTPAGEEADADDPGLAAALRSQRERADAVLLGRVTFEEFRGYWPRQTDDRTGISDYLNNVSKYVVSQTLRDPDWENTTVLSGPLLDDVDALKARPGGDIVVTGSMTLVAALMAAGRVDEYRLFVYPLVLGRGQRVFEDAKTVPRLRLVEAQPFDSGVVLLRYSTN